MVSRGRLVVYRWFFVIAYAVIAVAVELAIETLCGHGLSRLNNALAGLGYPLLSVGTAAIIGTLGFALFGVGVRGMLGIRHLIVYPATLVAVLLALALRFTVEELSFFSLGEDVFRAAGFIPWIPIAAGIFFCWILAGANSVTAAGTTDSVAVALGNDKDGKSFGQSVKQAKPFDEIAGSKDIDEFHRWISDDNPIVRPGQDRFHRAPVARRIAAQLLNCSTPNGPTIALVGKLGSGKTSILRLVEYYLNHANELKALTSTSTIGRQRIDRYRIHLCRVSNWGFSSTDAGLYHIAECILDTIKQEVDCLAIRGIPRQLASAFTGLGGWAQSLVGLLTHRSSAEAVLRRLSDVLVCTKTRVIVCIEDFERCAPSSNDANHYAALFDRIGRTPGLGLILTDIIRVAGDEGTPYPVDYLRLCRIIESIRDLNAGDVWSVITMFREYALADIRDPGADHRKEWPSTDNLNLRQKIVETIADAITSAVTGPRTLKLALRETHLAWQRLGGEIDFDDLLISNIIRAGLPGVWKYVLSNADELQSKKRQESSQETRARDSRRPKEFQRSCDAAGITLRLGELLVQELFPSFSVTNSGSYDHSVSKPQGVAVQSQVDYWERLLSGEIGSGDIRDQDVLGEIEYWQGAGENAKLPSLFVSSAEFRSRIIHFSAEVMPDRVLDLVGACLAYHRRYLNTCDNPGGLIAAGIDLTERARVPVDELRTWFKREVSMAFDVSLLFAWWFVTHVRDQQVCLHLPDEIRDSTFVEFLREFARRTSNSVEEFLRLMRGRDQYLLRYIVFSEKPPGAPLSELKHWNSFATTWLNAMESDPAIMSEPVVELLADHVGDFRDDDPETGRPKLRREFKLNEKVVHDLFDDNPRLWRWLANLDESLVEDRCMRKFAIRLREKAREKVQQTSSTE